MNVGVLAAGNCQGFLDSSTTEESSAVPEQLRKFIETRDRRVMKASGWRDAAISETFRKLLVTGSVVVGGRSSCGGKVDPTWVEFTAWNEVVQKARALGFDISKAPIKHGNAWATKCGGFWDENEYTLARANGGQQS